MSTCNCDRVCWHRFHDLTDPDEIEQERQRVEDSMKDAAYMFAVGDSQAYLAPVPGRPEEAYLFSTYTPPEKRGQGGLRAMMDALYARADDVGLTLVTHPENAWLQDRLERNGWHPDEARGKWNEITLYKREPRVKDNVGSDPES